MSSLKEASSSLLVLGVCTREAASVEFGAELGPKSKLNPSRFSLL